MSAIAGARTGRNYINHAFNNHTDDMCLLYRSVPLQVANKLLRVPPQKNDYDGIKQVYNESPSRPQNLLTMIQSLSRLTGEPFEEVAKRVIEEERKAVKDYVDEMDDETKMFMAESFYLKKLGEKTMGSFGAEMENTKKKFEADFMYRSNLAYKGLEGLMMNLGEAKSNEINAKKMYEESLKMKGLSGLEAFAESKRSKDVDSVVEDLILGAGNLQESGSQTYFQGKPSKGSVKETPSFGMFSSNPKSEEYAPATEMTRGLPYGFVQRVSGTEVGTMTEFGKPPKPLPQDTIKAGRFYGLSGAGYSSQVQAPMYFDPNKQPPMQARPRTKEQIALRQQLVEKTSLDSFKTVVSQNIAPTPTPTGVFSFPSSAGSSGMNTPKGNY